MSAKELREKRQALFVRIKEIADKANAETRDYTPEEQTNWDQLNTDYDAMSGKITQAERIETLEAEQRSSTRATALPGRDDYNGRDAREAEARDAAARTGAPTNEERSMALRGWLKGGTAVEHDERTVASAQKCGVRLGSESLDINLSRTAPRTAHEARALSAITGEDGGYLAPDEFIPNLEEAMLAFGGMRAVAEVVRTSHGNDMPWPTSNDTSNTGEQVGESADASTVTEPTFGQLVLHAYKFSSKMVKIPSELSQDSFIDIAALVGKMLGERLGRITNTKFTTGGGNATPHGIVSAATLGKTAASGTAILTDEIIDLLYSVGSAYADAPGAAFMMHRNVLAALRKLQDGNGQYIWAPGLIAGEPDTLFAKRVHQNTDMSSTITSGDVTILFGDLSKYKIRDVQSVRMLRLVERYAEYDQQAFIVFSRHDGNLIDAGTNPVKYLAMA